MTRKNFLPNSATPHVSESRGVTYGKGRVITEVLPPARAVVDLNAFQRNLARLRSFAPNSQQMAIVKADAYGHGIEACALAAVEAGSEWLGVAQVSEAVHLRQLLDKAHVLHDQLSPTPTAAVLAGRPYSEAPCPSARPGRPRIFAWIYGPSTDLETAIRADIDLSASTSAQLEQIASAADAAGKRARVHLKIDTGMARGGALPGDFKSLCGLARARERSGLIEVNAVWSHFASADDSSEAAQLYSTEQLAKFAAAWKTAWDAGLTPEIRHIAASGGILWYPESHFELVRPGITAYGLSPNPEEATSEHLHLEPVMRLEAEVIQVKQVPEGTAASYGSTWVAKEPTWLALIPVGYGDGLPRAASNGAPVWVAGKRGEVVGRVCMDQIIVSLGPAVDADGPVPAPANVGDTAILFGDPSQRLAPSTPQQKRHAFSTMQSRLQEIEEAAGAYDPGYEPLPSADEWAAAAGTISYEITTQLGPRIPRVYISAQD